MSNLTPEQSETFERLKQEAGPPMARSWLLEQPHRVHVMVFHTLLPDNRRLVVGKGRGMLDDNGEAYASEVAYEVVERVAEAVAGNDLVVVDLLRMKCPLRETVANMLEAAKEGSGIMFFADDDHTLALLTFILGLGPPLTN